MCIFWTGSLNGVISIFRKSLVIFRTLFIQRIKGNSHNSFSILTMNKQSETNKQTEATKEMDKKTEVVSAMSSTQLGETNKKNEWVACLYYKPPENSNTTDDLTRSDLKEMIEQRKFIGLDVIILDRISLYSCQPHLVGKVVEAYQAEDGSVYIRFRLDSDTTMDRFAIDSIGKTLHEVDVSAFSHKKLRHVILCEKSDMPNARILADGKKLLD